MSAFFQQQDLVEDVLENYRALTIHCLVAGDYLRPSQYTIETLILHFAVDQNANVDASIGNWILLGVVVRIAMHLGLHRDPSHWPGIRPLQAELRRRLWMTLYQMDFFTSAQVGLPRIVKDSQCDTRAPAHLFDNDLGPEHDEIPPERPLTETTALLFIIQRNAIIRVAAEIYDATEAGPPTVAARAELDAKLASTVNSIPPWFKYKSLETSIADDPGIAVHQISLDILIHKAIYLLHRRSFVGNPTQENAMSNKLCIDAALAILGHQQRISEEIQPGGLMFGIRWKVRSSLNHEFLQATMMLCYALSRLDSGTGSAANSCGLAKRPAILESLGQSKVIWEKNAPVSIEAQKAVSAIAAVLRRDEDRSAAPAFTTPDGKCRCRDLIFPLNFTKLRHVIGSLGQTLQEVAPGSFSVFDYEQSMAWDPSFFTLDDQLEAFETPLYNDVTQHGG